MTKIAVLGVYLDSTSDPLSIKYWLLTILRLLEITFFAKGYEHMQKNRQKARFLIFAYFPYIKDPQMYRKSVVSGAPGKSPPNFIKLFFWVRFMN